MKNAKPWDEEEGLEKLRKYCAWQERCKSEVWTKLSQIGGPRNDAPKLLAVLEQEGFLDENRFARAYARGKFNQNGWGKVKIRMGLRSKHVPEEAIEEALELIQEDAYQEKLQSLIEKKIDDIHKLDWESGQKLRGYLQGKGYEASIIEDMLRTMGNQQFEETD